MDNTVGSRYSRWWDAYEANGGGAPLLPLAMTDSGYQVADGLVAYPDTSTQGFYLAYRDMVDSALARPPHAHVEAYGRRSGDRVLVTAWITNITEQTLEQSQDVTVTLLIYEENRILLTDRFVRAATGTYIPGDIPPGATRIIPLETASLTDVDWSRLHAVVIVDYRPNGYAPPYYYEALQAAHVLFEPFVVQPDELVFLLENAAPVTLPVALRGAQVSWQAAEELAWLTLDPATGAMGDDMVAQLVPENLVPGWQSGTVTFNLDGADGYVAEETVPVRAYLGPVWRAYLPVVRR